MAPAHVTVIRLEPPPPQNQMPSYTQVLQETWVRDLTGLIPDLVNLCLDYLVISKRECMTQLATMGYTSQDFERESFRLYALHSLVDRWRLRQQVSLAMGLVEHVIGHYPILSDGHHPFAEYEDFLYSAMRYPTDDILCRLIIDCGMPFSYRNYRLNRNLGCRSIQRQTHQWMLEFGCIRADGEDMLYQPLGRKPKSLGELLAFSYEFAEWAPNYIDCWIQTSATQPQSKQLLIDFVQTMKILNISTSNPLQPLMGKAYTHLFRVLKVPRYRLIPQQGNVKPNQWSFTRRMYSQPRRLFHLHTKPCHAHRDRYLLGLSVFYGDDGDVYLTSEDIYSTSSFRGCSQGQMSSLFQPQRLQQHTPVYFRLRHLRRRLKFYYQEVFMLNRMVTRASRVKWSPGSKQLVFGSVAMRVNHR